MKATTPKTHDQNRTHREVVPRQKAKENTTHELRNNRADSKKQRNIKKQLASGTKMMAQRKKLMNMTDSDIDRTNEDLVPVTFAVQMHPASGKVAQLEPKDVKIRGITHLVRIEGKSIFEGKEVAEVEDGDVIKIESGDSYFSRRGPHKKRNEVRYRRGPQKYQWFKVMSVNNFKMSDGVYVRKDTFTDLSPEDKIDKRPWIIFGLDGRRKEQIKSAIDLGYRRFDCAESYNNTNVLSDAIKEKDLNRRDYEITYKFDVNSAEKKASIKERINKIQSLFEGKLDTLIIHNLEDSQGARNAWQVMNELKHRGEVREIGLGNISAEHKEVIKNLKQSGDIDVIENSLESVLSDENTKDLIDELGVPVYYYDVIKTAQEIGVTSETGIKVLILRMHTLNPKSKMIMSSSKTERLKSNIEKYGMDPASLEYSFSPEEMDALSKLDKWQKDVNKRICQTTDDTFKLPENVFQYLVNLSHFKERDNVKKAAEKAGQEQSEPFIKRWILANTNITAGDLEKVKVPSRKGLKKKFLGKTLGYILTHLFAVTDCDVKWAYPLVLLLCAPAATWDNDAKKPIMGILIGKES